MREATALRNLHVTTREQTPLATTREEPARQQRHRTATNKDKIKFYTHTHTHTHYCQNWQSKSITVKEITE